MQVQPADIASLCKVSTFFIVCIVSTARNKKTLNFSRRFFYSSGKLFNGKEKLYFYIFQFAPPPASTGVDGLLLHVAGAIGSRSTAKFRQMVRCHLKVYGKVINRTTCFFSPHLKLRKTNDVRFSQQIFQSFAVTPFNHMEN